METEEFKSIEVEFCGEQAFYTIKPDQVVFEDLEQALDYLAAWRDGRAAAIVKRMDACRPSTGG